MFSVWRNLLNISYLSIGILLKENIANLQKNDCGYAVEKNRNCFTNR